MSNFLFKQYSLVNWQSGNYTGAFFPSALARSMTCDVIVSGQGSVTPTLRLFYSDPFGTTGIFAYKELMSRTLATGSGILVSSHFNVTGLPIGQIAAGIEVSGANARTSVSVFQQS